MDEIAGFINARLDEWERLAMQAVPVQTGSRDEGQPPEHVSWRRNAGHPEFALRHVPALRLIVTLHNRVHDCPVIVPVANPEAFAEGMYISTEHVDGEDLEVSPCTTLRALAADFSRHRDYRPEWKP